MNTVSLLHKTAVLMYSNFQVIVTPRNPRCLENYISVLPVRSNRHEVFCSEHFGRSGRRPVRFIFPVQTVFSFFLQNAAGTKLGKAIPDAASQKISGGILRRLSRLCLCLCLCLLLFCCNRFSQPQQAVAFPPLCPQKNGRTNRPGVPSEKRQKSLPGQLIAAPEPVFTHRYQGPANASNLHSYDRHGKLARRCS